MKTITTNQLNDKIKNLPLDFLIKIDNYIDSLLLKDNSNDWINELTDVQKNHIEQGKNDIQNQNTFSNKAAKEKIKNYLNTKKNNGDYLD